jgi:hypothetical protein
MKVFKMMLWLVMVVVGVVVALSVYLYFNQKSMVFFPVKELAVTPDDLNLSYEDVYLTVGGDKKIHGWFIPADSSDSKVVLFCHGNGGNISHRLETILFLRSLNTSILLFDYRGYGLSDGQPSEDNVYGDVRACYDWLVDEREFQPGGIIIFGRSLGGAVAIDLAAKVPCAGLVVESSFTSAKDMARKMFPFLPTSLIVRYKFDSIGKISSVAVPIVFIHSPQDEMIPFEMGEKLYERATGDKTFVRISGGHNDRDYMLTAQYRQAFENLLDSSH